MGRVRKAIVRLACGTCGAEKGQPCRHRTTHREMKNFHSSRRIEGRGDVLNAEMAKLEGDDMEAFFQFAWIMFGLQQKDYPVKVDPVTWVNLYRNCPEIDPANQYHGEF